jgi:hypothetical protein
MKKVISTAVLSLFLFSLTASAQEVQPKQKKKAKTEKGCSESGKKCCSTKGENKVCAEKKSCDSKTTTGKKEACCSKKA